jgi:hypothetical protein
MKQRYREISFRKSTLKLIEQMNSIIEEYIAQGYVLTVRQLFYQLVARAIIENTEKSYKNVAGIVNDARIAGLIDWDAIEDRTRSFVGRNRWTEPKDILRGAAEQYHTDPRATQEERVFLIVEKEALSGVFQRLCRTYDIPLLAARGYPSASVVREFAETTLNGNSYSKSVKEITLLHFGDHDPSGIDMTRDLEERFDLFSGYARFKLKRLALNFNQIEELSPPPNPAKTTDSRFVSYRRKFGESSWELDALPPDILNAVALKEIEKCIDTKAWDKWAAELKKTRAKMVKFVETFK